MFKDLRPNTPFYILYKGEKPKLETGTVVNVTTPMAKPLTNYNTMYPQPPEMVVDIKVKVGNNILTFEKLPANNVIADFSPNGIQDPSANLIISSNRDMIKTEVETMLSQSKSVIESISYHQNVVTECEDMLKKINPTFAKEKEQESTIKGLENKIQGLEKRLSSLDRIEQMLLKQSGNQANPVTPVIQNKTM